MYLIIVLFVILLYMYLKSDYRRIEKLLEKFPGPPKYPLLGNALQVPTTADYLPYVLNMQKNYPRAAYIRLGPVVQALIFSDARGLELLLNSTTLIEKPIMYDFWKSWLGYGLLLAGGSRWRKHRKILTPAFHFKILEKFVEVFDRVSNIFVRKLRQEVGKTSVDIYPYVTLCTLDVICESTMGISINAQMKSDSEYVRSVKEMCRIMADRVRSLPKQFNWIYRLSKDYKKEQRSLKILHGVSESIIRQRRRELESSELQDDTSPEEVESKRKMAFLDLLLQVKDADGKPALTDTDIREEVDTFMFEGHDTTGAAISFLMYCLANHPEVQAKAVDEVHTILGDNEERALTFQDLQSMKYLEMVIKETLRLYPSVPILGRQATEDIEFDGKIIPKGTVLGASVFGAHRDASVFPDPEKFDPERFAQTNDKSPFAYAPFSAGPRNCIGQKFAMLEMKATISKVLQNFELLPAEPEHKCVLLLEVILKSANGIHIRLEDRKNKS